MKLVEGYCAEHIVKLSQITVIISSSTFLGIIQHSNLLFKPMLAACLIDFFPRTDLDIR